MKKLIEALFSNAAYSLLSLLAFVILAKGVSPEVFGEWILFLSTASFVDMIRFGITRNATLHLIANHNLRSAHMINGAGLRLDLKIMGLIAVISLSIWVAGRGVFYSPVSSMLLWYPFLGFSNIIWNNGMTWLQWRSMFREITTLRVVMTSSFIVQILLLLFFGIATVSNIIIVYVIANLLASGVCFLFGWDSSRHVTKAPKDMESQIMNFGKHSTISNIGSGLFKVTDIVIIGLSPIIGVVGVAIYAIPFKVIELMELPIRSIAMVGFDDLTEKFQVGIASRIRQQLIRYSILMLILVLPVLAFVTLFPALVVELLGGVQYTKYYNEMRMIIYLFAIYGAVLIPDRLITVALEAMGKPMLNVEKLIILTIANIIGDFLMIFYYESIIGVVFVTVLFAVVGVLIGYYMIPRSIRPAAKEWIPEIKRVVSYCKIILRR